MNQVISGETSTDDIEHNPTMSTTLANVSCEEGNLFYTKTVNLLFRYM